MPSSREKKAIASKLNLLKTIGNILKDHNFSNLSINLVSEQSGVDKAFIYRHYKDFDNLLKAYIEQQDFWLANLKEITKIPISDHRKFMKDLLISQFTEIYKNEEFQQFLVWEMGDKSGFTSKVSIEREILAKPIFEQCKDILRKYRIDLNVIYAWFSAGIYYLILHKDVSTFCEYDFTIKEDVDEFLKTLTWVIDLIFDKIETNNRIEQIAINAYKKGMSIDDIAEITNLSKNLIKTLIHSY